MTPSYELYILLPVHNRKKITLKFIQQLKEQTTQNFKLLLIDDGSTDGTSVHVSELLPESIILKGDGNLWWGGSLQLAINFLKKINIQTETPVLIINDDTTIGSSFLESGLNHLASHPKTLICASMSINGKIQPSSVHINWKEFTFKIADKETVNCLPTRGLFLKFGDIIDIGEFYPRILPHYFSDYEFTHRAFRKGFKLISPSDLWLEAMPLETGIRSLKGKGMGYLKRLFSIRYTNNPQHTAVFILLAAPGKYKPINLLKLLIKTIRQVVKNLY